MTFGRSFDEYVKMFDLTGNDLQSNILGVEDGPASFNSELSAKGGRVTSVDPIYVFEALKFKKSFMLFWMKSSVWNMSYIKEVTK